MAASLGLFTLKADGLSTEDTYTKEFDSIKGQKIMVEHGLQDNSNTVQIVTNSDQLDQVVAAIENVDGVGDPTSPAGDRRRPFLLRGHDRRGHLVDCRVRHRREHSRCGALRRRC